MLLHLRRERGGEGFSVLPSCRWGEIFCLKKKGKKREEMNERGGQFGWLWGYGWVFI